MSELYSEHPAMFKNNPIGFILSRLLIPVFGLGLLIFLVWHLKNKASRLSVDENQIFHEKGLLNKERSEININSVRAVKVKQSFFNRIFGVGLVEIYTSGDEPEIVVSGIPDPNKIRELVKTHQSDGHQS